MKKNRPILTCIVGFLSLLSFYQCAPPTSIELDPTWKNTDPPPNQNTTPKQTTPPTSQTTPTTCTPIDNDKVNWIAALPKSSFTMVEIDLGKTHKEHQVTVTAHAKWKVVPSKPTTDNKGVFAVLLNRNNQPQTQPIRIYTDESTCFSFKPKIEDTNKRPSKLELPEQHECKAGRLLIRSFETTTDEQSSKHYKTASCTPQTMSIISNRLYKQKLYVTMRCHKSGVALLLIGSPKENAQAMKIKVE